MQFNNKYKRRIIWSQYRLFDTANILTHSVVHVECITTLGSRFAVCYPFLYADLQLF